MHTCASHRLQWCSATPTEYLPHEGVWRHGATLSVHTWSRDALSGHVLVVVRVVPPNKQVCLSVCLLKGAVLSHTPTGLSAPNSKMSDHIGRNYFESLTHALPRLYHQLRRYHQWWMWWHQNIKKCQRSLRFFTMNSKYVDSDQTCEGLRN